MRIKIFLLCMLFFNQIMSTQVQTTSKILMVKPVKLNVSEVEKKALAEFDTAVTVLQSKGITVFVMENTKTPISPAAFFPNNWVSFHPRTTIYYPLFLPNRRIERIPEAIKVFFRKKFVITEVYDLGVEYEAKNQFVEGTASLVLDRANLNAYGCKSVYNNEELFQMITAQILNYTPYFFHATDELNKPILYTNTILSIGTKFVVICAEAFKIQQEKEQLYESFNTSQKKIIEITLKQVKQFASNIVELQTEQKKSIIVMSQTAFKSFTKTQLEELEKFGEIVTLSIPTIETIGGGSARSMIAEIFLPYITQ